MSLEIIDGRKNNMNDNEEIEINPVTIEMLFDRLDSIGKEIEELVDELKNRKG